MTDQTKKLALLVLAGALLVGGCGGNENENSKSNIQSDMGRGGGGTGGMSGGSGGHQ